MGRFWAVFAFIFLAGGMAVAQVIDGTTLYKPVKLADMDRIAVTYTRESDPMNPGSPVRWFLHVSFCPDLDDTKVTGGVEAKCRQGKSPINLTAAETTVLTARLKQAVQAANLPTGD